MSAILILSLEIIPLNFRPDRLIITIYYLLQKIKKVSNKVTLYFFTPELKKY